MVESDAAFQLRALEAARRARVAQVLEGHEKGYLAKDEPIRVDMMPSGGAMVTYSRVIFLNADTSRDFVDALVSSDFPPIKIVRAGSV